MCPKNVFLKSCLWKGGACTDLQCPTSPIPFLFVPSFPFRLFMYEYSGTTSVTKGACRLRKSFFFFFFVLTLSLQ